MSWFFTLCLGAVLLAAGVFLAVREHRWLRAFGRKSMVNAWNNAVSCIVPRGKARPGPPPEHPERPLVTAAGPGHPDTATNNQTEPEFGINTDGPDVTPL
jgi:hypothetical protein